MLSLRHELARKSLHLTSAAAPIAYALGLPRRVLLAALVVLLAIALGVELLRHRAEPARTLFTRATGPLLRAHEQERGRWSGATWMLLSYVLVTWLAPAPAAIAAMWGVAVGDAAAAIVGRWIGRRRIGTTGKSLEGTLACAVASTAGALVVAGLGPAASVAAGVAAAAAEYPSRPFDDNVRVAGAVALTVVAVSALLPLV